MNRQTVKNVLYGGITGLMSDTAYYKNYSPDPRFGTWSDEGKKALHDFVEMITINVAIAEKAEIERVAKEITMAALKGDKV